MSSTAGIDNTYGIDMVYSNGYQVNKSHDYTLVGGVQKMWNNILRCLLTNPGDHKRLPDYGCGIGRYAKKKQTSANLAILNQRITSNLIQFFGKWLSNVIVAFDTLMINNQPLFRVSITANLNNIPTSFQPFDFKVSA